MRFRPRMGATPSPAFAASLTAPSQSGRTPSCDAVTANVRPPATNSTDVCASACRLRLELVRSLRELHPADVEPPDRRPRREPRRRPSEERERHESEQGDEADQEDGPAHRDAA